MREKKRQFRNSFANLALFLTSFFVASNSEAFVKQTTQKQGVTLPSILKANNIDGDKESNIITATGNVELTKGDNKMLSDKMLYNKDKKEVNATGNVTIRNVEIGKVFAKEVMIKDDFSQGTFLTSKIVMVDGSYLTSPQIDREDPQVTVLKDPIYSICPNEDIGQNNELAGEKRDFLSIKSNKTTIDRNNQFVKLNGGVVRFYSVPFLYTPYLKFPLPSKKRESGFLHPSYTKNNKLGIGVKIPYYFNIAPNMDLITTPHIQLNNDQFIVRNEFRHLASYGQYQTMFEFANNKIVSPNDTAVKDKTKKEYRWQLSSTGVFDFTKNTGLDFTLHNISDSNYLRDYFNDYSNYTTSKVNVDYINARTYHAVKTIRIQELENNTTEAPFILPMVDSHIETKPLSFNQKLGLTSNLTVIKRESGLQYRRLSATPEVNLPINLHGNLFNFNTRVESDAYSLENNFKYSDRTNDLNTYQTNYKPEFSLNWRLPLIKKTKSNSLLIEPMANFVVSSFKRNFEKLPNEDSNNSELTINNLFNNDRIAGFDRSETGKRVSYGAKSSLFTSYGENGLTIMQSLRKTSSREYDVSIRGFNDNNKSNIVGSTYYKAVRYFSIFYNFQLNESDYINEINEVNTSLDFSRFSLSSSYTFLRKSGQNLEEREQINGTTAFKVGNRWSVKASASKDLVSGRILSRSYSVYRDGCCTTLGFITATNNPGNLIRPEKTYNINLSIKNL